MSQNKVIIIGGGLGGLFCGAILSKEGWQVTVLEKHYTAGGGLHTFKRNGQQFDTGMHYVAGFEEGGALRKLTTYLGIFDKLDFSPLNEDAFDILRVGRDGSEYRFPLGEEAFTAQMCRYFPHQQEQVKAYMHDLETITDPVDMLRLRYSEQPVRYEEGRGLEPLGAFMKSHFSDPKLIGALLWNSALYGGNRAASPTYLHAVISRFFIKGATRFANGSQPLADALTDMIQANGGEVRLQAEVCKAELDAHNEVKSVRLTSGENIEGTHFISTVHPQVSLSWFPESAFSKAFTDRIMEQKHTDATFSLFITLKPERFPFINSNIFYASDYEDIGRPPVWEASGPRIIMAFTPPSGREGVFARSLKVSAPISYEPFRRWQKTHSGERGDDYEARKYQYAELLLKAAVALFPDLPKAIELFSAASPLTYQHYTGSVEGSNYGFFKDCHRLHFSRLLPRTKIPNFFFSGQNLNMHGILGVPISAVITCGELIGLEGLLKKMEK
ncbi:MAG: NAD(P)/FAD-dependent oxidoreductase [Bacteroidetes bacterium]|nr:NAD(P)/FAD-dependent oxidoreductase [Bacteroidota bacterium]